MNTICLICRLVVYWKWSYKSVITVTLNDSHGVSQIAGQSSVCSTVCLDWQQRDIKGLRYCPFVRRIKIIT